ncbi:hypothetical protein DUNSADRAFT_1950 [Dunaliella salina]|uniref:Encoded protein n=1 Tax=Dunaliella salina TaxID=3046 RepID=A0ABQ7GWF4_DUNSA|nr:hypothetical protein DUNSADRAFT_1950 [Dunaliella salina]|eukprot:KAF5838934.1 hypothetical protein DUNSADRAFT_1950 [Dunaliella salina]
MFYDNAHMPASGKTCQMGIVSQDGLGCYHPPYLTCILGAYRIRTSRYNGCSCLPCQVSSQVHAFCVNALKEDE